VFCTEDLQLVKGTGRVRRRFVDLILAQTQPGYLALLQRYTRALRSRNALLKRPVLDPVAIESFSRELVTAGEEMIRLRRELMPKFVPLADAAYRNISSQSEQFQLEYRSSVKSDFTVELAQSAGRERNYRSTLIGPHRDELALSLNDRSAAQYASEGQKRTLVIALKMAQAEYLRSVHGAAPVLLIDDIMGELDAKRRGGFLPLLENSRNSQGQVFMTATEESWPAELAREAMKWKVSEGRLERHG
jgi:DNA replication and repair protein RecF